MRRYSKGEIIGYLQIIDFIFDDELLPGEVGKSMYLCKCLKCKTRLRVEGKYIPCTTTTCANCNRSPSDRTKLRSKGKSGHPYMYSGRTLWHATRLAHNYTILIGMCSFPSTMRWVQSSNR